MPKIGSKNLCKDMYEIVNCARIVEFFRKATELPSDQMMDLGLQAAEKLNYFIGNGVFYYFLIDLVNAKYITKDQYCELMDRSYPSAYHSWSEYNNKSVSKGEVLGNIEKIELLMKFFNDFKNTYIEPEYIRGIFENREEFIYSSRDSLKNQRDRSVLTMFNYIMESCFETLKYSNIYYLVLNKPFPERRKPKGVSNFFELVHGEQEDGLAEEICLEMDIEVPRERSKYISKLSDSIESMKSEGVEEYELTRLKKKDPETICLNVYSRNGCSYPSYTQLIKRDDNYIFDYQDGFDHTYRTYVFKVPEYLCTSYKLKEFLNGEEPKVTGNVWEQVFNDPEKREIATNKVLEALKGIL